MLEIKTLGELKKSGYTSKTIKWEMRTNLIQKIKNDETIFEGIIGFDDTVIPDLQRAVLSQHNVLLLGLRGQAKTRIARLLTTLLDEYIPIIAGSEINDDPLQPISKMAKDLIVAHGDDTPIEWLHRNSRYIEKLATPDVSVADLIGDIDPIKAASLKLPYSDERVIHYGLVPRANRCLFVINELPDLQPRIQVSLFNILQEKDLQIRGFVWRLPLDLSFVFTANPEDYTNRGSIITPLKDRIESQILTHYSKNLQDSMAITAQEAKIAPEQKSSITILDIHRKLIEMIIHEARESEYIDEKSGVSARMGITSLENLYSTIERRMLLNNETIGVSRLTDFWGIIPSINGKMELVYEGEQEGIYNVALNLIFSSTNELFNEYFPSPNKKLKKDSTDEYSIIKVWFGDGNEINFMNDMSQADYKEELLKVPGLKKQVDTLSNDEAERFALMEIMIFGLSENDVLEKNMIDGGISIADIFPDLFNDLENN